MSLEKSTSLDNKRVHYYPNTEPLNFDEMRLISLGTGMPTLRESQASTSFLLELPSKTQEEPERFLFDFGTGSMAKYAALQIPYENVRKAFISHLHSDHWGDLWPYWVGGVSQGRTSGIEIWGPSGETKEWGTHEAIKHALKAMKWDVKTREDFFIGKTPPEGKPLNSWYDPEHTTVEEHNYDLDCLNVRVYEFNHSEEVTVYKDEANGIVIKSWPAFHALPGAVSFSLEWNDLKFVFSGDTAPLEGDLERFKVNFLNADILIHECFTPAITHFDSDGAISEVQHEIHEYHTSPEDYGKLMCEYDPKHAVAYHFYNDFDTSLDTYNRVRENYKGRLTLAKDLLVWNITKDRTIVRNIAHHPDSWVGGLF
ncbi:ribonuclease Z [Tenacibaculum sp. MAR_2009_124]|uniref:MBL fold metallo-hydrolase n=1 Tax=Tenacibaculum sp. MAR_2009_124 TaxID=1250059 RepID=UPI000899F102|nr:MBL fold metallo-hydrolase [Tenacibaculum sp. MAR_2009_124]SEB51883.1 ribonuclease Z [Tenacibaculum sp. MAR_2009_124]